MSEIIVLSIKEANLLRKRLRKLLDLRRDLLNKPGEETVHDLRVASRRIREALDYFQASLPADWYTRLNRSTKKVTRGLGDLRETEVNLTLLQKMQERAEMDAVAAEVMKHSLDTELRKLQRKAHKKFASQQFAKYQKFLSRLKGSRQRQPTAATIVQQRAEEFWSFPIEAEPQDKSLHDLRIRTKKFRYSVEIYHRIHGGRLGHFLNRVKRLQEVLGDIHDLFVLGNRVQEVLEGWKGSKLELIPAALEQAHARIMNRKISLYPRVRVLYGRIIDHAPAEIQPIPKELLQAAESILASPAEHNEGTG